MDREEMEESLDGLRAQIRKLGKDDEPVKRRMRRLVADLERQLEDSGDSERHGLLLDSLREYIEQFEVEHPRLTGALNRIMVSLSNIGI